MIDTREHPLTLVLPVEDDGFWASGHEDSPSHLTGQLIFRMQHFEANSGEVDRWLSCRFYFDPKCWDVDRDGYIYTNRAFVEELHKRLEARGWQHPYGIDYSESGMQGRNYVDFDVSNNKELLLDLLQSGTPVYNRWPEHAKKEGIAA